MVTSHSTNTAMLCIAFFILTIPTKFIQSFDSPKHNRLPELYRYAKAA